MKKDTLPPPARAGQYDLHPACAAWPEMPPAELGALAEDIAKNGLHDSITLTPIGLLLDGRNRVLACEMAGVEIPPDKIETYSSDDPWGFAASKNDHRRHMTDEQRRAFRAKRAAVEAAKAHAGAGGDRRSENFKSAPTDLKSERQAKALADDVANIRVVQKHGTAEEKDAVMSGKSSLRRTADKARVRARSSPQKATEPNNDSVEKVRSNLERELVAKCSDQRLTLPKIAAKVGGVAESSVRDALCRLKQLGKLAGYDDVVVTNSAEGGREYWVDGEHAREALKAQEAREAPAPPGGLGPEEAPPAQMSEDRDLLAIADAEIADLKRQLAEKNAEITDLKHRLTERDAEIADLLLQVARLKAQVGEDLILSPRLN
jgi:hypothetical protein